LIDSGNNSVISTYQLGVTPQNDFISGSVNVSSIACKETDFKNSYGNALPLQVFGSDTFELTDPDKSYDGVKLVIRTSLTGENALQDQLSIPQDAGFISLNENNVAGVYYQANIKFAEIKNNNSASVELVFNSNATDEMINHLRYAISYCNISSAPTLTRNILLDFYGPGGSLEKTVSKTINVIAVDSAPTAANVDYDFDANLLGESVSYKSFSNIFIDMDGDSFYGIKITDLSSSGSLKLNSTSVTKDKIITAYDISQGKLKYYPQGDLPILDPSFNDFFNFSFKVISQTKTASIIGNASSTTNAGALVESANTYKYKINLTNNLPEISADTSNLTFSGSDKTYYSLNFGLHITDEDFVDFQDEPQQIKSLTIQLLDNVIGADKLELNISGSGVSGITSTWNNTTKTLVLNTSIAQPQDSFESLVNNYLKFYNDTQAHTTGISETHRLKITATDNLGGSYSKELSFELTDPINPVI